MHKNRLAEGILAIYIALALIITPLIVIAIGSLRSKSEFYRSWYGAICLLSIIGGCSAYFSPLPGRYFHERALANAKDRLEMSIPRLEAFYDKHGHYPATLKDISIVDFSEFGRPIPTYLNNDNLYRCDAISVINKGSLTQRSLSDNNYRSNGKHYELCISHKDEISASGNKSIYSSIEQNWTVQYIYSSASWDTE